MIIDKDNEIVNDKYLNRMECRCIMMSIESNDQRRLSIDIDTTLL